MSVLRELKRYIKDNKSKNIARLQYIEKSIQLSLRVKQIDESLSTKTYDLNLFRDYLSLKMTTSNLIIITELQLIEFLNELLQQIKNQKITMDLNENFKLIKDNDFDASKFISDLNTVLELLPITLDDSFTDERLKSQVIRKRDELIGKLEQLLNKHYDKIAQLIKKECSFYLTKHSVSTYREKKNLETLISNLEIFESLFDEEQVLKMFPSKEIMNEFFEEINRSSLREEEKLEIISLFTKFNLQNYLDMKKVADNSINVIVDSNKKTVHTILDQKASQTIVPKKKEEKQTEGTLAVEDKKTEISLTEEEQQIYDKLKEISNLYSVEIDLDDIELLDLENNFSVEARLNYVVDNNANWKLIAADIEHNLLPNISKYSQEIGEILKYILEIKQNEEEKNQEKNKKLTKANVLLNSIVESLADNSHIWNTYNRLDGSMKSRYDTIIGLINQGLLDEQIEESIKLISNNVDVNWFKKLIIFKELSEYVELLEEYLKAENISEEDLQYLEMVISDELNNLKSIQEKSFSEAHDTKEEDKAAFERSKNLIIFNIKEDVSEYSDEFKSELESTIYKLKNEKWDVLRRSRSHFIASIRYNTPSGEQKEYDELFEPYRIKNSHTTRTGLIKIKICRENADKIRKRYALENDLNSLFIITGVIGTSGEDHSNYKQFNDYIDENKKYLNYIARLFANPNADEKGLFKIIDENCSLGLGSNQLNGGK